MPLIDLTGQRFGRLTVKCRSELNEASGQPQWECVCDCGADKIVRGRHLRQEKIVSCGCHARDKARVTGRKTGPINILKAQAAAIDHGMAGTPTHSSWRSMRDRCNRPENASFPYYGGRGITYCEQWDSFTQFLADMGKRPEGKTLDRIDPNGNYEPANCRWATPLEQRANRTDST